MFLHAGYRVKKMLRNMPLALLQRDFGDANCKGKPIMMLFENGIGIKI